MSCRAAVAEGSEVTLAVCTQEQQAQQRSNDVQLGDPCF